MQAVLFDMDGTLVPTVYPFTEARREVCAIAGRLEIEIDESRVGSIAQMLEWVRLNKPEVYRVFRKRAYAALTRYDRRVNSESHTYPEVPSILERLRLGGARMAVVSNSSRRVVRSTLSRNGILECFETLVTRDDSPRLKPYPDPVILACSTMKVSPLKVVFVGDSWVDVESGNAAGVRTIQVGSSAMPKGVLPWRRISDLTQVLTLLRV